MWSRLAVLCLCLGQFALAEHLGVDTNLGNGAYTSPYRRALAEPTTAASVVYPVNYSGSTTTSTYSPSVVYPSSSVISYPYQVSSTGTGFTGYSVPSSSYYPTSYYNSYSSYNPYQSYGYNSYSYPNFGYNYNSYVNPYLINSNCNCGSQNLGSSSYYYPYLVSSMHQPGCRQHSGGYGSSYPSLSPYLGSSYSYGGLMPYYSGGGYNSYGYGNGTTLINLGIYVY